MTNKTNSLSQCRKAENVTLLDIAYLLNMDIGNLSKVERGERDANPRIILLYHILFETPIVDLFSEQLIDLKHQVTTRCASLIEKLEQLPSSKSKNRIAYLKSVVNSLEKSHE